MPRASCFVIGQGIVALRCLEILRRVGFSILGVYSADGSLRTPAEEHGFLHSPSLDALKETLLREGFDFLFSINNGWVIPEAVILRARRGAINFHDSPLPRYAGLYATSWALVHGEREHAVSWHEIIETIDGGRIYKQRPVSIEPDDTALTLNTKCYEAAVAAFEELAPELFEHRELAIPQKETGRSYFGLGDRPRAACTLSCRQPAEAIGNLVRALDFGPPKNPLGLPKLFVGGDFIAVTSAKVHADRCGAEASLVVRVAGTGITVATATADVTLSGFRTLSGAALSVDDLRTRYGVDVGRALPELSDEEARAITEYYGRICRHENGWARRLATLVPWSHPYAVSAGAVVTAIRIPLELPEPAEPAGPLRAAAVLSWFAAYFARLSPDPALDVGYFSPAARAPARALFAPLVPLRIAGVEDETFARLRDVVAAELARCERMGSYALDLFARYPELRPLGGGEPLPVALARVENPHAFEPAALGADLVFAAYDDGSPPELFSRVRLEPWQIEAIAGQLARIAGRVTARPDTKVAELPLLDDNERQRVLVEWNQTRASYPRDRCIHELVTNQATRTPEAPSVRFGGTSISYEELERRSHRLAAELRARGAERGSLVVLCLPRGVDMVVGLLGILKAGAAYVPVDPSYPRDRVAEIVADSAARLVVSHRRLRASFFSDHDQVLCLDDEQAAPDPDEGAPLAADVTPDDLAYVIYTSGSTGNPKGVEVLHRGLVNHSWAIAKNYGLGPGDRLLCSASISFDVAGEQIYPALFAGAEVVVRPDDLFDSFTRFDAFVRDEAITAMVLPTAFWHEWVRDLSATGAGVPPPLRVLSVGTEKALGECLGAWQALSQGRVSFFQGYGPTEATVTSTMYVHDGSPFDAERALPIGRPLPNTEIFILDGRMRPVPVGFPGELYIGGDGLARGYHRRPELTDEKFVAHPFRAGERLYRTGDQARYEPDGQIVYIGRTDFQVKVRGFRIELGEIEDVLRHGEGIAEAIVVLREERGHKRLVAYVVAEAGRARDFDASRVKAFAAARLPEYMVPAAVVRLASFPMTANQKVDRKALPAPPRADDEPAVVPPESPSEREIAASWIELLGPRELSVFDDFYAIGGNSLSAVRMLSRLEAKLGATCSLVAFNRAPTIARLAELLASKDGGEESLVITLQEGDARPPLWLFHPVGGHVAYGQWLQKHMDASQPILGVVARGVDGKRAPLDSTEEMAALYLQLIRARQPRGPYFLAGPSMGGQIALEIAQRLRQTGETIGLLALLDTRGPNYPRPTSTMVRVIDHVRELSLLPTWRDRFTRLRDRLGRKAEGKNLQERYDVLGGHQEEGTLVAAIQRVTLAAERANIAYRPRPYHGSILLFRATRPHPCPGVRFDDPMNGWGPIARGGLRIISVPCHHLELADTPPADVGRGLQRAIDEALAALAAPRGAETGRLRAPPARAGDGQEELHRSA